MNLFSFVTSARRVVRFSLLLGALLTCAASVPAQKPQWVTSTSSLGDFTVSVPEPLKTGTGRDGWTIQQSRDGNRVYEVRCKALSDEEFAKESVFERLCTLEMALLGEVDPDTGSFRNLLLSEIRLGREFRGNSVEVVRFGRVFASGTCLYALLVDMPPAEANRNWQERESLRKLFFNSFKVIGTGCPDPQWEVIGNPGGSQGAFSEKDLSKESIRKWVSPVLQMSSQPSETGTVTVRFIIGKTGKVIDAFVVDGPLIFRASALIAITQCEFNPFMVDGKPANIRFELKIKFEPATT